MPSEKPTEQQVDQSQPVTREEFATIKSQADSLASMLRKEREAAEKRQVAFNEQLAAMAEKMAALTPQDTPAEKPGKTDPAVAKYDAELKAMKAQLEAERAERERERASRMQQEERAALQAALTTRGVTGPHLKGALALLYAEEKRVTRDDNGNIAFKVQRNGFDETMPLEAALDEWLRSDDGKAHLPPRAASGSGVTPGRPQTNGAPDGQMTKAEAARRLPAMLLRD